MYTTYILFSDKTQRYYIGSTQNLDNRISEHNSGETKSTRRGVPWIVVWLKNSATRSDALKLEARIKKRGAKRFLMDVA